MIEFLVWLVACFMSTFGFAYLYYKLVKCNHITLKTIITFIIGVVIITFIKYFDIKILSFSIFFIYYPILFYVMNPLPFKKLIYYVLVVWFLGIILDLLSMLFVSWLHKAFSFNLLGNWMIASISLSFIVFICLIIIAKIKKVSLLVEKLYNRLINIKYSDLLIVFLAVYIFISCYVILSSLPNLTIDILLNLLIILVVVVFVFLIKYKINEEEIAKYLKILKENNEFYINVNDENRIFKHNLISKLLSIKSVSNKKGMILIEELVKDFNQNIDFSENIKVIPYGLNGIIYQKLYPVMNKVNVHVNNEIHYDIFEVLKPIRYNVLVEKLSIVLDNAIESSLKSADKIIIISIFEEGNNIVIEVKNSFSSTIDLDSLGSKNYSTKGKKRGLGLFSALRNNEATLRVKVINNFFVSKISAQKK